MKTLQMFFRLVGLAICLAGVVVFVWPSWSDSTRGAGIILVFPLGAVVLGLRYTLARWVYVAALVVYFDPIYENEELYWNSLGYQQNVNLLLRRVADSLFSIFRQERGLHQEIERCRKDGMEMRLVSLQTALREVVKEKEALFRKFDLLRDRCYLHGAKVGIDWHVYKSDQELERALTATTDQRRLVVYDKLPSGRAYSAVTATEAGIWKW